MLPLFYRRAGPCGVKVEVSHGRCISCAGCVGVCPVDTITLKELHLVVEQGPCISCGLCIQFCPVGALTQGAEYGVAPPTRKPERVILV
jgi:formate hydrogenlyase subunit 6/NADH:ubiquinone oxidoreductase subunit I